MTRPSEAQGGVVFGSRVNTTRVVVAIDDDSDASIDICFYGRSGALF
jgi:hypothetical protein